MISALEPPPNPAPTRGISLFHLGHPSGRRRHRLAQRLDPKVQQLDADGGLARRMAFYPKAKNLKYLTGI